MNQILELAVYVVIALGILVLNKLVLQIPELNSFALLLLGAAGGFARGSYVPPLTTSGK